MCFDFVLYVAKSARAFARLIDTDDGKVGECAELKFQTFFNQCSADVDKEVDAFSGKRVVVNVLVADVFGKNGPSEALECSNGRDGGFFPLADDDGRMLGITECCYEFGREVAGALRQCRGEGCCFT